MKINLSSKSLAESIILRANSRFLLLIGNERSRGTGPCAAPPPLLYGALLFPILAFPRPFCGAGFLPDPATSPTVFANFHTFLPLCSKYSKTLCTMSLLSGWLNISWSSETTSLEKLPEIISNMGTFISYYLLKGRWDHGWATNIDWSVLYNWKSLALAGSSASSETNVEAKDAD